MEKKVHIRRLLPAKLLNKYKPKADTYSEGALMVSLKLEVYDPDVEGGKVETWLNFPANSKELELMIPGRSYWLFKEWSAKKKNKDSDRDGAFVYRYVNTEAIESGAAREANRRVAQKTEAAEAAVLSINDIRAAVQAAGHLVTIKAPAERSPLDAYLAGDIKSGALLASSAIRISDGMLSAHKLLIRLGQMYAILSPPIGDDSGK